MAVGLPKAISRLTRIFDKLPPQVQQLASQYVTRGDAVRINEIVDQVERDATPRLDPGNVATTRTSLPDNSNTEQAIKSLAANLLPTTSFRPGQELPLSTGNGLLLRPTQTDAGLVRPELNTRHNTVSKLIQALLAAGSLAGVAGDRNILAPTLLGGASGAAQHRATDRARFAGELSAFRTGLQRLQTRQDAIDRYNTQIRIKQANDQLENLRRKAESDARIKSEEAQARTRSAQARIRELEAQIKELELEATPDDIRLRQGLQEERTRTEQARGQRQRRTGSGSGSGGGSSSGKPVKISDLRLLLKDINEQLKTVDQDSQEEAVLIQQRQQVQNMINQALGSSKSANPFERRFGAPDSTTVDDVINLFDEQSLNSQGLLRARQ